MTASNDLPTPSTQRPSLDDQHQAILAVASQAQVASSMAHDMRLSLLRNYCTQLVVLEWELESFPCPGGLYGNAVGLVTLMRRDGAAWSVVNIDEPDSTEVYFDGDDDDLAEAAMEGSVEETLSAAFSIEQAHVEIVLGVIGELIARQLDLGRLQLIARDDYPAQPGPQVAAQSTTTA